MGRWRYAVPEREWRELAVRWQWGGRGWRGKVKVEEWSELVPGGREGAVISCCCWW